MKRIMAMVFALFLSAAVGQGAETAGQIVYSRKDGDRVTLHVMNADGTGDRELPGLAATVNLFPAWSPDGKRIAFTSGHSLANADRDYQVCVFNADGTNLKTLNMPHPLAAFPVWSQDGKRLALAAGDEYPELEIYTCDPDGNGLQLVKDSKSGVLPFWSPDDTKVGYSRPEGGGGVVVLAKVDGSGDEVLALSATNAGAGGGGFSGDGKRLLFIHLDNDNADVNSNLSVRLWDFPAKSEQFLAASGTGADRAWQTLPFPCWEAGGKSFLMVLPSDKGRGVFRLSEEGKTLSRLTPEGVNCLQVDSTGMS